MNLEELFENMPADERLLKLGYDGTDQLTSAFTNKRVVHAGVQGRPVPPDAAQEIWNALMQEAPQKKEQRCAYIHIPFCQTKCLYCGFYQNAANQEAENRYIDYLIKEIERASETSRMQRGLIHSVFIGGGTPSSLSPANAERLLKTICTCLPLANDYELTLEGRIHDLVPAKMDVWMSNGVNRVSLGVQSFNTDVRRQMGRLDDKDTIIKRLEALQSYQQCAVVVDLIYGLPDQDMKVWLEDLAILEAAPVDGMDLYQLNVFDGSDLSKRVANGTMRPAATTQQQAEMYAAAIDFLEKRNFNRLSICHWNRSNRERSIYNSMAKRGYDMFPFGCGAGGHVGGYSMMLHRTLAPYEMTSMQGKKPFMFLMQESSAQVVLNIAVDQLEKCYFDLRPLVNMDARLSELKWLLDLWCERKLMHFNGLMYKLTTAGEFWQVNVTQTIVECIHALLTGEQVLMHQKIAEQDHFSHKKMK